MRSGTESKYKHANLKKKTRIAFLTSFDPFDESKLSGSVFHMLKAFERHGCDLFVAGPVNTRQFLSSAIAQTARHWKRAYNFGHSYYMAWRYRKAFANILKQQQVDCIFAPRSSTEIALLNTHVPIIYYSDTTFASLYNYYEWFSGFMRLSEWEGNRIEKAALHRSKYVVFSSQWAADSAIRDYGVEAEKVSVVPMGPNLRRIPLRDSVFPQKDNTLCKLLFIGVEWERKGGIIAYETLKRLKQKGIKASLTVCGCTPPGSVKDPDMHVIPYLNKKQADDYERFERLLRSHHFFILPTRAECFGVVFCEASAFGLPSLTTDTGGIPTAVRNDINGYRFPLKATAGEYADRIASLFLNYDGEYLSLCRSSRDLFESELNWDAFAVNLISLLNKASGR